MNTAKSASSLPQLPVLVMVLAVAALAFAAAHWLAARIRQAGHSSPIQPVSREFAERFGSWSRIPQ